MAIRSANFAVNSDASEVVPNLAKVLECVAPQLQRCESREQFRGGFVMFMFLVRLLFSRHWFPVIECQNLERAGTNRGNGPNARMPEVPRVFNAKSEVLSFVYRVGWNRVPCSRGAAQATSSSFPLRRVSGKTEQLAHRTCVAHPRPLSRVGRHLPRCLAMPWPDAERNTCSGCFGCGVQSGSLDIPGAEGMPARVQIRGVDQQMLVGAINGHQDSPTSARCLSSPPCFGWILMGWRHRGFWRMTSMGFARGRSKLWD